MLDWGLGERLKSRLLAVMSSQSSDHPPRYHPVQLVHSRLDLPALRCAYIRFILCRLETISGTPISISISISPAAVPSLPLHLGTSAACTGIVHKPSDPLLLSSGSAMPSSDTRLRRCGKLIEFRHLLIGFRLLFIVCLSVVLSIRMCIP